MSDGSGFLVRPAVASDMDAIREISSLTWEGHDYLHEVALDWMAGGGFYVGQLDGVVIGTGKISRMPGDVLWLEGLRIHSRWQGRGFGRILAGWLVDEGSSLVRAGKASSLEFCTYIYNDRSISTSRRQGFRQVDEFWVLYRDTVPAATGDRPVVESHEPSFGDYSEYGSHIPCGWKPPRNVPESVQWLEDRCSFYRTGDGTALHDGGDGAFSPCSEVAEGGGSFFDAVDSVLEERGSGACEIILGGGRLDLVEAAVDRGFLFWDPTDGPNMLVFRLDQV